MTFWGKGSSSSDEVAGFQGTLTETDVGILLQNLYKRISALHHCTKKHIDFPNMQFRNILVFATFTTGVYGGYSIAACTEKNGTVNLGATRISCRTDTLGCGDCKNDLARDRCESVRKNIDPPKWLKPDLGTIYVSISEGPR
ncbi:hypothetical protein HYFRA_00008690 [Hymenoscyphus fraxineus]|uniref:Uncharacterized protein n=1 Tax=Hymenoscyphus fraxineus TaxID=746836 RepID=A0A9N9KW89_9HELO|nr:hypothetical protein HYFRA_00008690 [Hymenoscyphus fraxineus]